MKLCGWVAALLLVGASMPLAIAQPDLDTPSSDQYVARLGDIMNAVQTRHIKLWLAGKAQNWDLARYEQRQLKAGLSEAALHYSGIPVTSSRRSAPRCYRSATRSRPRMANASWRPSAT